MPRESLLRAWPLLVVILSVALAFELTWPIAAHLGDRAVGYVDGDGIKHIWTLWWMRTEFWEGAPGLATKLVNFPEGMDLFPIEPLNGVAAVLSTVKPVLLSNLLAIAHLSLTGIFSAWLGWLVTGRRLGAIAAGVLAEGASFSAFTLHVGVGELRQVWWIPLGLACLVKARETLSWRWFLTLAAVLAGAVSSCFYHGLFLALATAVYALATLRPNVRLLAGYALAAGLAMAISYPIVKTFSASYGGTGAPMPVFDQRGIVVSTYEGAAMELDQLVRPRSHERAGAQRQEMAYTGGRYLGIVALGLAAIGIAAAPRIALPWLAVLLASIVLSLGNVLWYRGEIVLHSGQMFVLPLAWINDALTKFAEPVNFPARFIAPGMIAMSVLGALATRWRWTVLAIPVALADIACNDLVPWPRASYAFPDVAAFADAPGTGAIADLGAAWNSDPEGRMAAIAVQMATGRPLSAVPIERLDFWASGGTRWVKALHLLRQFASNRPTHDPEAYRRDAFLLRERGFDSVLLVGNNSTSNSEDALILDAAFGQPVRSGRVAMWPVPEATGTEVEIAAWRAEHKSHLDAQYNPHGPTTPPGGGTGREAPVVH